MPSRKRAKGKERKLKQQARQSVSSSHPSPAVGGDISLPEQHIQRLVEQAKNMKCLHGGFLPPRGHPVNDFIRTFQEGCISDDDKIDVLMDAMSKTYKIHRYVWEDDAMRKMATNYLLCVGTDFLLDDFYIAGARKNSQAIIFLEMYGGGGNGNYPLAFSKATEDFSYMSNAEDRDVVRFYKKRIPCSCLDKLYSKIQKIEDRGSQCSHCKQTVKSKDLKTCSRCKFAQYCSKECQISHWPSHKVDCMEVARLHDSFKKAETLMKKNNS